MAEGLTGISLNNGEHAVADIGKSLKVNWTKYYRLIRSPQGSCWHGGHYWTQLDDWGDKRVWMWKHRACSSCPPAFPIVWVSQKATGCRRQPQAERPKNLHGRSSDSLSGTRRAKERAKKMEPDPRLGRHDRQNSLVPLQPSNLEPQESRLRIPDSSDRRSSAHLM